MTTATVAVELERFQLIPTGDGPTLLRVAARWRAEKPVELDAPVLVIDDGNVQRIFEALPGPRAAPPTASPDGPRWQAGFSVPAELLAQEVAFALDAGAVGIIGLPAPVEADTGLPHAPPASDERVVELERRLAAERHARREVEFDVETHADADIAAQSVAAERTAQVGELERELAASREQVAVALAQVDRARLGAERARADADELRGALESAQAELERARDEAASTRADADAARQRVAAVDAQMQEAERLRRAAEERAERAEAEVREHGGRTEAHERELADARRLAETRAAAAREARDAAEARAAEAERALEAAMGKRD